jgi:hypothetical protein
MIMRSLQLAAIVIIAGACSQETSDGRPHARPLPQATLTGKRPLHMRNCPSAVVSATTIATPTPDGVNLTITSDDPDARRQIVKLAEFQSGLREALWFMPAHSGLHGGPGTIGYCPVIHTGTIVTYRKIADGVQIHVAARRRGEIQVLQRATESRVAALVSPRS